MTAWCECGCGEVVRGRFARGHNPGPGPRMTHEERLAARRESWRKSKRKSKKRVPAVPKYQVSDDSRDFRGWWLERYTLQEIRDIWGPLEGALNIQKSAVHTAPCEARDCHNQFPVRAQQHNQRFCTDLCRRRENERLYSEGKAVSRKEWDARRREEYKQLTDKLGVKRDWRRMTQHLKELRDAA